MAKKKQDDMARMIMFDFFVSLQLKTVNQKPIWHTLKVILTSI